MLGLISPSELTNLAGGRAFQLGEEYFEDGAVGDLAMDGNGVSATVEGAALYRVALQADSGGLAFSCTCPRAAQGYFCKHCVALGLAWHASLAQAPASEPASLTKPSDTWDHIRTYLDKQSAGVLIDLILDAARRDAMLARSLLLKAQSESIGPDVFKVFRKAISNATRVRDFVPWDRVDKVATNLDRLVDALAELLQPAASSALVPLLEFAIERVETMLEHVDDSSGAVGDIVHRLGPLHLQACSLGAGDVEALAERMFRLWMELPIAIWSFDPIAYRDALGAQGLARLRQLAQAEWQGVAPRKQRDAFDGRRWRITALMERLAMESGDTQQLVDIKSRDLSLAYSYLDIAEVWKNAGDRAQALAWAERGLAAFPERTDNRLRDFLVDLYLGGGRHEEALQLTWIQLEEGASLETYRKLADIAAKLGCWEAQRARALALIDARIAAFGRAETYRRQPGSEPDMSLRVAIALWENNTESALALALRGRCDLGLLTTLAAKLEDTDRIDDAVAMYQRIIPLVLEQTGNRAYENAVTLLKKMGAALARHQRDDTLEGYALSLRLEFKRKRNFIKLLDQHFPVSAVERLSE